MKTGLRLFLLWLVVFFAHQVYAQETSDKIVENVRKVCEAPSERGKYWKVEGAGQGKAKINIKLLGEVGGTGTVTLTQGEWEGVQQVLQEKQANENADYRDCAKTITPLFLKNFATKKPQLPQSGADKKATGSRKIDNSTASISQQARDNNTQIGNNYGNVVINPEKDVMPKEPTISMVQAQQNILLVHVYNPPSGDAVIIVNDKDISAQLKSEYTPIGMKVYHFEGSPDQLNLSMGKNKVVAKYGDTILPAYELKYTELQRQADQRYYDQLQQIEAFRKQHGR